MLTGLLFGQERTQYSGIERNDIFQEYNEQPHEGDPIVLFNSGFQHLNTIRNRDGDLYLRFYVRHTWDENQWFSDWKKTGKSICESYIMKSDSRIYEKKIINPNWVFTAFKKIELDRDIRYLTKLVSVLALEIWLRVFITKELNANKKL